MSTPPQYPSPPPATSPASTSGVTQLLLAWGDGDRSAGDALLPVIYGELHRQAVRAMRRENDVHTLQPTALVNEAYLRLVDQRQVGWRNRAHFFGVAATIMRRILIDHARARLAGKRGAGARSVTLEGVLDARADASVGAEPEDLLALHDALVRLATLDERQARVVELRYFGGLNIEETAEAMALSPATVKREWSVARAWLRRELGTSG